MGRTTFESVAGRVPMISTTIKRKWMDKILSGEKTVEYKPVNDYWKPRIDGKRHTMINFLCGHEMLRIESIVTPLDIGEFAETECYAIHLGERVA